MSSEWEEYQRLKAGDSASSEWAEYQQMKSVQPPDATSITGGFADYRTPMPAATTRVDPSFQDADRRPVLEGMTEDLETFTGVPRSPYAPKLPPIESKFKGDFGMRFSRPAPLTPDQQKYAEQNPLEQAGGQLLRSGGRYGLGIADFLLGLPGKVASPEEHVDESGPRLKGWPGVLQYGHELSEVAKQEGAGLRQMAGDFIPTLDYLLRGLAGSPDPSADIEPLSPVTKFAELIAGKPMTQENYRAAINRLYESPETPLFTTSIGAGAVRGGLGAGRAIAKKVGPKLRAQPLEHRGFTEQPTPRPGTMRIEKGYEAEGLKPVEPARTVAEKGPELPLTERLGTKPPTAPPAAKQPWEMTKEETRIAEMESRAKIDIPAFSDAAVKALRGYRDLKERPLVERGWREVFDKVENTHRNAIKQALSEGKPVPAEVLKDYPELGKKAILPKVEKLAVAETAKPWLDNVPKEMEHPINRVTYERGKFLESDIISMSKGEKQTVIDHLVKTKHPMVSEPGTTVGFIKRYAKEIAEHRRGKAPGPPIEYRHAGLRPEEVIKSVEAISKGIQKTAAEVSRITDEIVTKAKTPPEIKTGVQEAKTAMIEHDRQIRRAESTSKLFKKTIEDAVPKIKGETLTDSRQMLMLHAFEQGKKSQYWRKLDGRERGMVEWALKEKGKLDRFIDEHKVLDRMEMPEGMHHISHWWINPKSGKPFDFMYGKFSKGTPLAKQRKISTFEAGMAKGLTPASTNLGEIIGKSWESVMRAHQSREMFKTLHSVGAAKEGTIQLSKAGKLRPIRMVERWDQLKKQGLGEDYVRYSHDALDRALTFRSADGTLVRLRGAVGVRKELYPFVRAYLDSPEYGKLSELNFAAKSLKLGFSLFHVISLGAQEAANLRVPFFNIKRGLDLRKNLDPTVRLLHQEGLELFKGYEDVGYRNSFFEGASPAGKAGNVATYPIKIMRDFIFDVVQPGMKTSFAVDMYNKLLPKYLEKGLTKERCARDVVKKADGHFSGEHYKRSLLESSRLMVKLYFMPEARVKWQAALLSPTWQREHILVAKNVMKSFMPDRMIKKLGWEDIGPIKSQYRRYMMGAVLMVGAADMYNYMMTQHMDGKGRHLHQNPKGKGFSVRGMWDEPDYTTIDKNGNRRTIRGGPGYVRPLKSVWEVGGWIKNPMQKLAYKLSPGTAWIGRQVLETGRGYQGYDLSKRGRDLLFDVATPITVSQGYDWLRGRKSVPGAILPFFGMPTSKEKRPKRKAR